MCLDKIEEGETHKHSSLNSGEIDHFAFSKKSQNNLKASLKHTSH
jgi:hypothetical protein